MEDLKMPPEIIIFEIHTEPKKATLKDFWESEENRNLCDNCGRKISQKSKDIGVCQICGNKFSGRILICSKCEEKTYFFWETIESIIVTCSLCNSNHRKEPLAGLELK